MELFKKYNKKLETWGKEIRVYDRIMFGNPNIGKLCVGILLLPIFFLVSYILTTNILFPIYSDILNIDLSNASILKGFVVGLLTFIFWCGLFYKSSKPNWKLAKQILGDDYLNELRKRFHQKMNMWFLFGAWCIFLMVICYNEWFSEFLIGFGVITFILTLTIESIAEEKLINKILNLD